MTNNQFITRFYHKNLASIKDHGCPWSKYILLPDDHVLKFQTKQDALSDSNILHITKKLNSYIFDPESPKQNPSNFRVYGSFYWLLRFLADIGIPAEDYGIASLIEQLKHSQLEDGQFMIRYHQKKQQSITFICMTAHLAYCLIRLGYKGSRTVAAAANYLATTQRFDGGWHCDQLKQIGERDQSMPSCPSATIHSILALSQFGEKYNTLLGKAVDFFCAVHENDSVPFCQYDSEIQTNFNKFRYPPHFSGLDILNIIYVLSFVPNHLNKSKIEYLLNSVLHQWDGLDWLASAKKIPEWKDFDFGNKTKGSDWITSVFLTSIQRMISIS